MEDLIIWMTRNNFYNIINSFLLNTGKKKEKRNTTSQTFLNSVL